MSSRDGQPPEYPSSEEWAARFAEAVLKPLREVGELLAREVDEHSRLFAELGAQVAELGRKVDELGVAIGVEPGEHSVKAAPECARCGHGHVLHIAGGCVGVFNSGGRGACRCGGYLAPERVEVTS